VEKRALAWWFLAEHVCARLASPKIDVAGADREIEALLRASWLWSRGDAAVTLLHAAWLDSRSRRLIRWASRRCS
jgi:hypothetical protein